MGSEGGSWGGGGHLSRAGGPDVLLLTASGQVVSVKTNEREDGGSVTPCERVTEQVNLGRRRTPTRLQEDDSSGR